VYRIERAKGLYRKRASDAPEHVVGDRGDTSSILRGNVRDEGLVPAERRAAVQGACRP